MKEPRSASRFRGWVAPMALYLLGIFMGAIDTGIVTPGRTVIQQDLGVDDQLGIWMITIYTLAYAAAIPIMGKVADRVGRKPVYLTAIALFGLGSLLCGLSQDVGSFWMLIAARAIQAIGGGGILPIATAEIGTTVPEERRGLALGLVGAVYGIANIFGASAGSFILGIVGTHNWQWIFYVNVPIAAVVIVAGLALLPNHREQKTAKIDVLGSFLLVVMILALLYGIRNIDFFDFTASVTSTDVWPYLLAVAALLPVFVLAERRAADPVLNLRYFTDFGHGGVLLLSVLSGVALMAVVFVPQFAENELRIPAGSGGYTVIALGLASGIGAPLSGTLTDRFGPKVVLGAGALLSLGAAACVLLWTIPAPGPVSVFAALILFGLGLGFVIGSPLNYMMLERVPKTESNSALGTLSLMRSLGTTIAPAVMVGFLAYSGALMQDRLIAELPTSVPAPALPYARELSATFAKWKSDPQLADQLEGVEFPDLDAGQTIEIDMNGGGSLPDDLVEQLRTADVTTIVDRTKSVAKAMFATQTPATVNDITDGVNAGIGGVDAATTKLDDTASDMADGLAEMDASLEKMTASLADMDAKLKEMKATSADMAKGIAGLDKAIAGMTSGIAGLDKAVAGVSAGVTGLDKAIAGVSAGITGLDKAIAGADAGIAGLDKAISGLTDAIDGMDAGLAKQNTALAAAEKALVQAEADGAPDSVLTPLKQQIAALEASIANLEKQRAGAVAERTTLQKERADAAAERTTLQKDRASAAAERTSLQKKRASAVAERTTMQNKRATLVKQRSKARSDQAGLIRARQGIESGIAGLTQGRAELAKGKAKLTKARADLASGRAEVLAARGEVVEARRELVVLRDAVPGAFDDALTTYLGEIDARGPQLEDTFASTLGGGFSGVFAVYGGAALLMLIVLPLIPAARREEGSDASAAGDPAGPATESGVGVPA